MDWTKAKTILIIALLATNLFLVVTYSMLQSQEYDNQAVLEEETIALLEDKNIYVKHSLPSKHTNMPVLTVEYDRLDPHVLQEQLWKQKPLPEDQRSSENMIKLAENFLIDCNIMTDTVKLDKIEQTESKTVISYRNEYQGMRVEDSYIICTIEGGQVIELDRYWLKPVQFGPTKRATKSASAALIDLMGEKHELGSIMVEDMEMIYWLDPLNFDAENTVSDTAFPAWKITYNDGQIKHIPAYFE